MAMQDLSINNLKRINSGWPDVKQALTDEVMQALMGWGHVWAGGVCVPRNKPETVQQIADWQIKRHMCEGWRGLQGGPIAYA